MSWGVNTYYSRCEPAVLNAKKSTQMAFINADWPARHRSRPKEAVSPLKDFAQARRAGAISKTLLPNRRPG